jgi:hypothetical protein
MKRRWYLLGGACLSCGVLAFAACGGDDTNGGSPLTPDGGNDSTAEDAPAVVPPMEAAAPDAASTPDAEAGAADAGSCAVYDASGLDEASVAAGFEQVWQVYRCAGCHQKPSQSIDDAGRGIVLSGNNNGLGDSGTIFPPNLTSDPVTGLGCWTDSQIQNALLDGIDDDGRKLCSPMPKFGTAVTGPDGGVKAGYPMDAGTAQEIVDYLRSLPVVVNEVIDTTCAASGADASSDAPSE